MVKMKVTGRVFVIFDPCYPYIGHLCSDRAMLCMCSLLRSVYILHTQSKCFVPCA